MLTDPVIPSALQRLSDLVGAALSRICASRLSGSNRARPATQPVSEIAPHDLPRFAQDLEAVCKTNGIDYASLGAVQAEPDSLSLAPKSASLDLIEAIPAAVKATENVFASVQIACEMESTCVRLRLPRG